MKGKRFVIMFFNCLLTFGSYLCFDMPSVLQTEFTYDEHRQCSIINSTDCCTTCLGMSDSNYNLLYAIYAWTNAVFVIVAGLLIDRLGSNVGALLFSSLCVVGSFTFAAAIYLKGTPAMLILMLISRLIFGTGNGSLIIVQDHITSVWFKEKELATAFAITIAFSRLGSVLNFFVTERFEAKYGLAWTLWGGAALCVLGFVSAIILSRLNDSRCTVKHEETNSTPQTSTFGLSDILKLSSQYWVLNILFMFLESTVRPFTANASLFLQQKYGESATTAGYMAGVVLDITLVVTPMCGGLVDTIGKRGYITLACSILAIPVFPLLGFTFIHPLISLCWFGFIHAIVVATLRHAVPLLVSEATLGTALGLMGSVQMLGVGIANLAVGAILDSTDHILRRWEYVMIFLLVTIICFALCSILLNALDARKGGILNQWRRGKHPIASDSTVDSQPSEGGVLEQNCTETHPQSADVAMNCVAVGVKENKPNEKEALIK